VAIAEKMLEIVAASVESTFAPRAVPNAAVSVCRDWTAETTMLVMPAEATSDFLATRSLRVFVTSDWIPDTAVVTEELSVELKAEAAFVSVVVCLISLSRLDSSVAIGRALKILPSNATTAVSRVVRAVPTVLMSFTMVVTSRFATGMAAARLAPRRRTARGLKSIVIEGYTLSLKKDKIDFVVRGMSADDRW